MLPLIVIPARRAATRLPDKPLADLGGRPMIVRVWERAMASGLGPVLVATDDGEIAAAVASAGGEARLTRADHPSGSDRVLEAVRSHDPDGRHDTILNLQGDLPTVETQTLAATLRLLDGATVDIGTAAAPIVRPEERDDPNVVKAVVEIAPGGRQGRALYFTRATAPSGDGPLYHHIGLYAWRREALERFVAAPAGVLERRERLEQLRALALGLRVELALVDEVPLGVDTPHDLERARAHFRRVAA